MVPSDHSVRFIPMTNSCNDVRHDPLKAVVDGIIAPIGDPLRTEPSEESGIQALKSADNLGGTIGVSNRPSRRVDETPCPREGPVHTGGFRSGVLNRTPRFTAPLLALDLLEASMRP